MTDESESKKPNDKPIQTNKPYTNIQDWLKGANDTTIRIDKGEGDIKGLVNKSGQIDSLTKKKDKNAN